MIKPALFIGLSLLAFPAAAETVALEQAQAIALEKEPGNIIETDIKQLSTGTVYEFEIEKDSGTVMEIEIDGNTGLIIEHKIDKLGPDQKLPEPLIAQADAEKIAIDHINETRHGRAAAVKETKYTLQDGKTVYEIDVIKSFKEYEVYIDANSGAVLSATEDD